MQGAVTPAFFSNHTNTACCCCLPSRHIIFCAESQSQHINASLIATPCTKEHDRNISALLPELTTLKLRSPPCLTTLVASRFHLPSLGSSLNDPEQFHTPYQRRAPATAKNLPTKKVRTSLAILNASAPLSGIASLPRTTTIRIKDEKPRATAQLSPPPSPGCEGNSKVDTEGINDDIVIGVIEQLQDTGNRPHLVKELAAVLATSIHAVDKSANPAALISSRLTSYLNRTRPAFTPCPLAKLIEPVHPRRLYFYLTTMPRQPLPAATDILPQLVRITPSLSSAEDEEEEPYHRSRVELSPSPEVDLSSPELDGADDEPASPARSFPPRTNLSQERTQSPKDLSHNRRAVSPQLEPEERTFKQTANLLYQQEQQRQNSLREVDMLQDTVGGASDDNESVAMSIEAEEDNTRDAVAELFQHAEHLHMPHTTMAFSSPVLLPQKTSNDSIDAHLESARRDEVMEHVSLDLAPKDNILENFAWDSLQSPEDIELAELEDMFDAY